MARLILSTIAFAALATIAFAALAAAVPQHPDHIAKGHIARSNLVFGRSNGVAALAGRSLSYDGSCGSWSGNACPDSSCCGPQGWCGTSETHCGTGCQVGFGSCGSAGSSSGSASPAPAPAPAPAAPAAAPTTTRVQAASVESSTTTSSSTSSSTTAAASPSTSTSAAPLAQEPEPAKAEGGHNPHPSSSSTTTASSTTTTAQAQSPPPKAESAPSPSPAQSNQGPTAAVAASGSQSTGLGDTYTLYTGDGSTGAGWPSESKWADFDTAFEANKKIMSSSCKQWNVPNDSDDEISGIKSAIQSVAQSTGVDARFILAVVLQESNGCVRAPTTNYGVTNPGLMQSHNGDGSCNRDGSVQNPCPQKQIDLMIHDGTAGTSSGDGLQQTISQAHTSDVSKYYKAARIYNSGSIAASGKLEDGIATHCYSSDIANRLTGWVSAPHGCSL